MFTFAASLAVEKLNMGLYRPLYAPFPPCIWTAIQAVPVHKGRYRPLYPVRYRVSARCSIDLALCATASCGKLALEDRARRLALGSPIHRCEKLQVRGSLRQVRRRLDQVTAGSLSLRSYVVDCAETRLPQMEALSGMLDRAGAR